MSNIADLWLNIISWVYLSLKLIWNVTKNIKLIIERKTISTLEEDKKIEHQKPITS